jgi:nucleotide-binding universal stress UspA family protein
VGYVVGLGDPADFIVETAEQKSEPGLIARLLGLSVSETVQRRAHSDVLIVH